MSFCFANDTLKAVISGIKQIAIDRRNQHILSRFFARCSNKNCHLLVCPIHNSITRKSQLGYQDSDTVRGAGLTAIWWSGHAIPSPFPFKGQRPLHLWPISKYDFAQLRAVYPTCLMHVDVDHAKFARRSASQSVFFPSLDFAGQKLCVMSASVARGVSPAELSTHHRDDLAPRNIHKY